jgi:hypothetical protein
MEEGLVVDSLKYVMRPALSRASWSNRFTSAACSGVIAANNSFF